MDGITTAPDRWKTCPCFPRPGSRIVNLWPAGTMGGNFRPAGAPWPVPEKERAFGMYLFVLITFSHFILPGTMKLCL